MLEGYRTYAYLIVSFLGWVGIGDVISQDNVGKAIDLLVQLVGIIGAAYYNSINHKKIEELKAK